MRLVYKKHKLNSQKVLLKSKIYNLFKKEKKKKNVIHSTIK